MVEDREFDDGMMKEEGRGREDEKLMRGCRRKKRANFLTSNQTDRQSQMIVLALAVGLYKMNLLRLRTLT
jgi:hypothetical protein